MAHLKLVDDLLADFFALFFQHGAAREDHVVAVAVHLYDATHELLADVVAQILHAADVDQGGRQEAAHPEVQDEAALDDLDDGALHRLAAFKGGLDALPRLLEAGALLAEDQTPVGVFFGHHQGVDFFAQLHLVGRIDRLADAQLVLRDDAFRLVADVDQDLVLVDAHDLTGDDVAFGEERDGGVVVGDKHTVDFQEVFWRPGLSSARLRGLGFRGLDGLDVGFYVVCH